MTLPSGTLIEYIIDGRNRRIGRKVDGTLEKAWLYKDGLNPIAEFDWDAVNQAWDLAARFAYTSRANVPDFMIVPAGTHAGTYRIISDHLGSPRLITNIADGTIKETIDYDAWGKETTTRVFGDFPLPFTFAGGLYDSDTKLIRFGARDYDPEVGRWTSKDPIRFDGDGPNLYGYTANDPVNFVDSEGLTPKPIPSNRTRARECNISEIESCRLECKSRGRTMESCKVSQTFRTKGTRKGKPVYGWYDGPMSCSCSPEGDEIPFCRRHPTTCSVALATTICLILINPIPDEVLIPVVIGVLSSTP